MFNLFLFSESRSKRWGKEDDLFNLIEFLFKSRDAEELVVYAQCSRFAEDFAPESSRSKRSIESNSNHTRRKREAIPLKSMPPQSNGACLDFVDGTLSKKVKPKAYNESDFGNHEHENKEALLSISEKKKNKKTVKLDAMLDPELHFPYFTYLSLFIEFIILLYLLGNYGFGYFCLGFQQVRGTVYHHSGSFQVIQISLDFLKNFVSHRMSTTPNVAISGLGLHRAS